MRFIFCFVVYYFSALQPSTQISTPSSPTYTAAVVEYSPYTGSPGENTTTIVSRNVENYVLIIGEAASLEADIIVFPECGLVALGSSVNFATPLPDPDARLNPCTDALSDVEEVIRILSCEAKSQGIYVVVNIPEKEACSNSQDCQPSGVRYYNSDVAFDRNGTIVARYRKYNLFGETGFSATLEPDHSVFETDFDVTFGMFTCFDIEFKEPAISLVKDLGITDIVFPTAWFSELPFLSAVQAQASWAYGFDVNFLAAGYNNPSGGSAGSGIYAGKEGPLVHTMPIVPSTQLLVATVPKKSSGPIPELLNSLRRIDSIVTTPYLNTSIDKLDTNNSGILMMKDYLEPYETLLLTEEESFSEHTLCHNELCCDFQVVLDTTRAVNHGSLKVGYTYRLAVFDGVRSYTYKTGGMQICALIFCTNQTLASCGHELDATQQETFQTVFYYVSISGVFRLQNTSQVPDTLVRDYGVLSPDTFTFTSEEISEENAVKVTMKLRAQTSNLLTFAIFGRDFQKDGGSVTEPSSGTIINLTTISLSLPIALLFCLRIYF